MNRREVCSVILAAGDSTRMGFPKALLPLGHGTFLSTILSRHKRAGLDALVILGSDHSQIRRQTDGGSFRSLHNPSPEQGPLSSLKIALLHIHRASALIVHPVDHPMVSKETLESLASEHLRNRDCIILPRYLGRKGHPVLFPSRFYSDLRNAPLSEGARCVVRNNRSSVLFVDVNDPGILVN
ncbi:MAG TPA: nucleotidyltransferase family protein, partial [Acidobacteriota bacterium]|nr:nucleotidyltransferase family protein [Acidobacteriota bacterium]